MSGRKPYGSRFTIFERSEFLDNDKIKPIVRRDRRLIDNLNLETLWCVKAFRECFIKKAEKVRSVLNLPYIDPDTDIEGLPFGPKLLYIGTNSKFLRYNPNIAQMLEKLIYSNFLVPFKWSYNFYPFVEYFVLYQKRTTEVIQPNPLQLNLTLLRRKELGRNKYTKSDIQFLKQRLRILIKATNKRSSKSQASKIKIVEAFLNMQKSDERPPRNPVLKMLCFDVFNTMSKITSEYVPWDEKQYAQFLKMKVPDLIDSYEEFFKPELNTGYRKMITDNEAYFALKRYHSEYLSISKL